MFIKDSGFFGGLRTSQANPYAPGVHRPHGGEGLGDDGRMVAHNGAVTTVKKGTRPVAWSAELMSVQPKLHCVPPGIAIK